MELTIFRRLWLTVGGALLALLVVAVVGRITTHSVSAELANMHEVTLPAIERLTQIERSLLLMRLKVVRYSGMGDPTKSAEMAQAIEGERQAAVRRLSAHARLATDPADRKLLAVDQQAFSSYLAVLSEALTALHSNDQESAKRIFSEKLEPAGDAGIAALDAHIAYEKLHAAELRERSENQMRRNEWLGWTVAVTGIVLGCFMGISLIRAIVGALAQAQATAGSMEAAVERVGAGVARARGASEAIHRTESSSRGAVEAVGEIANAMQEQSSASAAVAQSVERIAQMAEQCSSAAQGTAGSARQLDRLARDMTAIVAMYRI
jgi:methyl-accepting chemotaxis protein